MKYIVSILVLVIFVAIYSLLYLINSRVEKPVDCKEACDICNIKCYRRIDK